MAKRDYNQPTMRVVQMKQRQDLSNIYGDIEFCAVYVGADIDCHSENESDCNWTSYSSGKYSVLKLTNRKLYRDGYWNTLTLPFSLDADKLANTCLAGADIRYFKNASWDAETQQLTLNFSGENENIIEAGKPCLIRWGTPENAPGDVIQNPIFTNVNVDVQDQDDLEDDNEYNVYETESNGVRYEAQIVPVQVHYDALVLGGANTLYKPNKNLYVWATNAYFNTENSSASLARELVLNFGDGEEQVVTAIDHVMTDDSLSLLIVVSLIDFRYIRWLPILVVLQGLRNARYGETYYNI